MSETIISRRSSHNDTGLIGKGFTTARNISAQTGAPKEANDWGGTNEMFNAFPRKTHSRPQVKRFC